MKRPNHYEGSSFDDVSVFGNLLALCPVYQIVSGILTMDFQIKITRVDKLVCSQVNVVISIEFNPVMFKINNYYTNLLNQRG